MSAVSKIRKFSASTKLMAVGKINLNNRLRPGIFVYGTYKSRPVWPAARRFELHIKNSRQIPQNVFRRI